MAPPIPQIACQKVYGCAYWKRECFALTVEMIVEKACHLQYCGFLNGDRPSSFFCLLLKLVQMSPSIEVIRAYLEYSGGSPSNHSEDQMHDLRYLRALAIAYLRLVGSPAVIYSTLEKFYGDYRRLNVITPAGAWEVITVDVWVELMLNQRNEPVYGFLFPTLTKRAVVQARREIGEYESSLFTDE